MLRPRHRTTPRRLAGVAWLALVLLQVLAQSAALVHAVAHARGPVATAEALAATAGASVATPAASGPDEAGNNWGHQAGSSACQLLDHLLAGQAPAGDTACTPGPAPTAQRVVAPAPSMAPGAAAFAYAARGPPWA